jgi:ubiquinone/menaquinone biosynthesis C-methylase UbiE
MSLLKPMGESMLNSVSLEPSFRVLDIASGTGEPGITIARMLSDGEVTGTDLSEDMLRVASKKAAAEGLSNFKTLVADACQLPLDDNSFDLVTCRMGLMFVPDVDVALREMKRVLKDGGIMTTTVWTTPQNNLWVSMLMSVIKKHLELPPPDPGAPGLFRFGDPYSLLKSFEDAGFTITTNEIVSSVFDAASKEDYWTMMTEIAAPVVSALSGASDETIQQIRDELYSAFDENFGNGVLRIPAEARLITATS